MCAVGRLLIAFLTSLQGPSGLHQYRLRTMFDEVPLPWDWPALVNYHEAKAFATWKTLKEEQVRSNCATLGVRVDEEIDGCEVMMVMMAMIDVDVMISMACLGCEI